MNPFYFNDHIIEQNNPSEIKLIHVEFQIETIGNNAKVKTIHTLQNTYNDICDVTMNFTLDTNSIIIGYSFTNGSDEFISILKEKESARKEFSDATINGYSTGIIEKKEDQTKYSIEIRNIRPCCEFTFTVEYLTRIDYENEKILLNIPNENQLRNVDIKISVTGTSQFEWEGRFTELHQFPIGMKSNEMIVMRDEDTDEVAVSSTFVSSETESNINVLFVCDRSNLLGEMEREDIPRIMKTTLQRFLKSLPLQSKCNIISYGSALGSDFDGITGKLEFSDASYMPKLYDALTKAGFYESDVDKIFYKNALRVFKELL